MADSIDYVSVSVAVRRLQQRLKRERELAVLSGGPEQVEQ